MQYWQLVHRLSAGVLRRRKLLTLISFLVAALLLSPIAYYLAQEPPRFRTTATILLETRPDRVPVFQEFAPVRPPAVQMAILQSRALAEAVIENLPRTTIIDIVENPYYIDPWLRLSNAVRMRFGKPPVTESVTERALKELRNARVQFEPKTDGLVDIKAEASTPQLAIDLANTYIEVLLARTRSFNADDARLSREFLAQQTADAKRKFTAAEDALRAFSATHGGVKIPERSQATATQLSQAESALAEVEVNRKMVETRLAGLREKLEEQRRTAPSASTTPRPTSPPPSGPAPEVRRLRDQLAQLEMQLLDLRRAFTDEHPKVMVIKNRLSEIQASLGSAVKETTVVTPAPTAVPPAQRVNFAEQVLALETSYHALSAQEEALRKQTATLRAGMSGLARGEMDYSRLTREADSTRNLYTMLADKLTAARIREQGEMNVIKAIDPPRTAVSVTSERRVLFISILGMLALVAGIAVPAGMEIVHKRVETEDDVTDATNLPVLASIPRVRAGHPLFHRLRIPSRNGRLDEAFMFCEAFRALRVAVQLAHRTDRIRSILITSAFPSEGKSTVVSNLGFALSEAGVEVLVADTDFLRPRLHQTLEVPSNARLGDLLQARQPIDEALSRAENGMWVAAPAQALESNRRGSLATSGLRELIKKLASKVDIALCDSPPVLVVPESLFLGAAADAVILVVKAGSSSCRDLVRAKSMLEAVGARIIGVVINEMPSAALKRHYRRYYGTYHETITRSHTA